MAAKKATKNRKMKVGTVVEKLVPRNLDLKGARKKIQTIEKKIEKKLTAALKPLKTVGKDLRKQVKLRLHEASPTESGSQTSRTRTKLRTRSAPRRKAARRG